MTKFTNPDRFVNRHIGPDEKEINEMLDIIGAGSLDELISETIPPQIRNKKERYGKVSNIALEEIENIKSLERKL